MNALEKARMAKEAERKQNEEKRGQNTLVIIGILMILIAIAFCIFSIIMTINQAGGLKSFDNEALISLKSTFYWQLGLFFVGAILCGVGGYLGYLIDKGSNKKFYSVSRYTAKWRGYYYEFDKKALIHYIPAGLNALVTVLHLVMVFVVLFSGKLGIIEYYSQDGDGIIYAQTKNDFKVVGIKEGVRDIIIRGEVNDYFMDTIKTNTFKSNNEVRSITFTDGDINFQKKAFKRWTNLEVINFDGYTYDLASFIFEDSSRLKEFNVGSSEITIHQEYTGYSSTLYDNILGGISNANINIDGGKLHYIADSVNMYKVGNNSEVIIVSSYEDSSFGNNCGYVVNKKLVLLDGFTFNNSKLTNQMKISLFSSELTYYPFAYTMYIPTSVTSIPEGFFGDRLYQYSDVKVHYAGSEAEWNNISITSTGNGNYSEGNVKVTFNSSYSE